MKIQQTPLIYCVKIISLLSIFFISNYLFAQELDYGAVGGINISMYDREDSGGDMEYSPSPKYSGPGFNGGIWGTCHVYNNFGIKSQLLFSHRIMQYSMGNDVSSARYFNYIDLSISSLLKPSNNFEISFGVQLSYLLSRLEPPKHWNLKKSKYVLGILTSVTYKLTESIGIIGEYLFGTSALEYDEAYVYKKFDTISLLLSYSLSD